MKTTFTIIFAFALLVSVRVYSQDPIAHWDFNENEGAVSYDSINEVAGTFVGNVTWSDDAHEGHSIALDGVSSYVQTDPGDVLEILRAAEDIAFTAYFKTNTITTGQQHIVWIGNTAGNGWGPESEFNITIGHFKDFSAFGTSFLSMYFGSGDVAEADQVHIVVADPEGLEEGKWHHIAAVVSGAGTDAAMGELYLDGELLTPMDTSETKYARAEVSAAVVDRAGWNSGILIGVGGNKTQRFFNGNIDNVKAFDTYLDQDAVKKDMIKTASKMHQLTKGSILFPNPVVSDVAYLQDFENIKTLEIFNSKGQRVKMLTPLSATLNIEGLEKGIYLLKAINHKGISTSQKFVRQ